MIQISSLTKSFGDRVLFDDVTWQISDGERVGLCGPNGVRQDDAAARSWPASRSPTPGSVVKPSDADDRLPAAGRPDARRPHGLRGGDAGLRAAAWRSRPRCTSSRTGSADPDVPEGEHEQMLAPLQRPPGPLPAARRLQHRPEDRDRPAGPRLHAGRPRAADRDVLGRLADAHRARQAAARAARTCCCSTSRPTTSTSTRATGSRSTCTTTRTPSSSSRTTATSSTPSSRASPRSTCGRSPTTRATTRTTSSRARRGSSALREAKRQQDEEMARMKMFIDRFRYQATKAAQVQSRIKMLEKIVPDRGAARAQAGPLHVPDLARRAAGWSSS